MKAIMMEAGGYAAESCRAMAAGAGLSLEFLSFDAEPTWVSPAPRETVRRQSRNLDHAGEDLLQALQHGWNHAGAVVLPTAEFMAGLAYMPKVREADGWGLRWLCPAEWAWKASRDKRLLASELAVRGFEWICATSDHWTPEMPFAKPAMGVGSRGAGLIRTKAEAAKLSKLEPYVFQPELQSEEHVIDVVRRPNGEHVWVGRNVMVSRGGADEVAIVYRTWSEIVDYSIRLAKLMEAPVLNVQWRRTADGVPRVIDVGTRFSGASSFGMAVGMNLLELLLVDRPVKRLHVEQALVRRMPRLVMLGGIECSG